MKVQMLRNLLTSLKTHKKNAQCVLNVELPTSRRLIYFRRTDLIYMMMKTRSKMLTYQILISLLTVMQIKLGIAIDREAAILFQQIHRTKFMDSDLAHLRKKALMIYKEKISQRTELNSREAQRKQQRKGSHRKLTHASHRTCSK